MGLSYGKAKPQKYLVLNIVNTKKLLKYQSIKLSRQQDSWEKFGNNIRLDRTAHLVLAVLP